MAERIKLALLWHMHQPYYKDPLTGRYEMPWVRLHALKDYWGMAALLEEFPAARVTFNLVPSLLLQIEDLIAHPDADPLFSLAFRPVDALTSEDAESMREYFFQANLERQISRFPRLKEIHERVFLSAEADGRAGFQQLSHHDLLDLQVFSQLCWFDEIYLENDPVIRGLVERGRGFTEEDKALLRQKEMELLSAVVPTYRRMADSHQIELSTSPFYHPILPLLCDQSIAQQSQPGLPLPSLSFRYPQDAALQLGRAIENHRRLFGDSPRGVWPSEGSVSNAVMELLSQHGIHWTATGEGILARTLGVSFERSPTGAMSHSELLHSLHRFKSAGPLIFFRDRELSDAIGFSYSRMSPTDAVNHFVGALKSSVGKEEDPCVSVILDGENAWEYYPQNGRPFLREFYRRVSTDADIEMVTFSEACERLLRQARKIDSISPGSWINSDFSIWIGDPEDNRAWELLSEARETLNSLVKAGRKPEEAPEVKEAQEALLVAEGSDWCWWYGPEHSSVNDLRFDRLFRSHLINFYRRLGLAVPSSLAQPLKRRIAKRAHMRPTTKIHPIIDGRVTGYFEWMGAGSIENFGVSMHPGKMVFRTVYYGWDEEYVYLRVDFTDAFVSSRRGLDLKILIDADRFLLYEKVARGESDLRIVLHNEREKTSRALGNEEASAACLNLFETRFRRDLWQSPEQTSLNFFIILEVDRTPVDRIPLEGSITVNDDLLE